MLALLAPASAVTDDAVSWIELFRISSPDGSGAPGNTRSLNALESGAIRYVVVDDPWKNEIVVARDGAALSIERYEAPYGSSIEALHVMALGEMVVGAYRAGFNRIIVFDVDHPEAYVLLPAQPVESLGPVVLIPRMSSADGSVFVTYAGLSAKHGWAQFTSRIGPDLTVLETVSFPTQLTLMGGDATVTPEGWAVLYPDGPDRLSLWRSDTGQEEVVAQEQPGDGYDSSYDAVIATDSRGATVLAYHAVNGFGVAPDREVWLKDLATGDIFATGASDSHNFLRSSRVAEEPVFWAYSSAQTSHIFWEGEVPRRIVTTDCQTRVVDGASTVQMAARVGGAFFLSAGHLPDDDHILCPSAG